MSPSPSIRLHHDPSDAGHLFSSLACQRDALRRHFDDVREMDSVGLSRLEFDQNDQPIAPSVRAIDAGDHLPVVI